MALNISIKKVIIAVVAIVAVAFGVVYFGGEYKLSGKEFGFDIRDVKDRVATRDNLSDSGNGGESGSAGGDSAGNGTPDNGAQAGSAGDESGEGKTASTASEFTDSKLADMLADRPIGNDNAPVTIYEHSSLTCPHCATFHTEMMPKLKKDFVDKGLVRIVFRDFSNDGLSAAGFMLTRCVPKDKYHDFLNLLFEEQREWMFKTDSKAVLTNYALFTGLTRDEVNRCFDSQRLLDGVVAKTNAAAQKYDITATPTAVIDNGHRFVKIRGSMGYNVYKTAINKLLEELD